jgi:hypothetical protein
MSDEGKPITAEHVFKRIIWRSVLAIGASMEQFTTWTITGIAGMIGLFMSHLDSVSATVTPEGLRWSLILLAASLLTGVVSKQIGMAVAHGVETVNKMEAFLYSADGQRLMSHMTVEPKQLTRDIASPFVWPLSWLMRRSGARGVQDYSSADRRFIRLFCFQLYSNLIHAVLAAAAIIKLAISIK